MTAIKAMRLASLVTAINVLVASGFSIAAIIRPQYLVPAAVPTEASLLLAMYAAAPRIPLALFVLGAIYKQATPALLILGARIQDTRPQTNHDGGRSTSSSIASVTTPVGVGYANSLKSTAKVEYAP